MYNYPYYWQNMQQCNFNSSQFYSYQIQSVNCMQRINEACTNVAFNLQQQRIEDARERYKDFPKSCSNCKHRHGTWCNKFQRYSSVASAPTALMGTGDCLGYRYWEPIKSVDDSLKDCCCETKNQQKPKNDSTKTCGTCKNWDIGSPTLCGKFRTSNLAYNCSFGGHPYWEPKIDIGIKYSDTKTSIATELYQCKTNEENLEVARKHGCAIDLTKPEKKYTVYDLYDLVFPDDPIKAHFDAERKRIEEKYKPQEEIAEKLEAPEVRRVHVEPIPTATYDDDMMTVIQAAGFWIGAIAFVVILILT